MTLVVDASFVVSALVDTDDVGLWAEALLASDDLVAPHLMVVEVASVLRRQVLTGGISADAAALAHADLLDLPVTLHPYAPYADRVWSLRDNLSVYDAHYVAVAEAHDGAIATLDLRMAQAPGPRCSFVTFPR